MQQLADEVLARSAERDQFLERIQAAWSEGWLAGHEIGWRGGYGEAQKEMETRWSSFAAPMARQLARAPSFPELERRRWMLRGEPRTRETFGQPHSADYTGRGNGPA
ncbi:MAG: hypothetical protein ACLP52_31825 [Streptosporangiaceae bacterium]